MRVPHNCSDAVKHSLIIKSDHFKMAHTNIDWKIAYCLHNNRVERICPLIEWVRLRHSTVRVPRNCSVKQCLCGWSFCMRITMRNVHICECHLVLHSSPSYHFTMFKNDLVCTTRQHCVAEGARRALLCSVGTIITPISSAKRVEQSSQLWMLFRKYQLWVMHIEIQKECCSI